MNRRSYLASVVATAAVPAGYIALTDRQTDRTPGYRGDQSVVYEHDDLQLRLLQDEVQLGDTVEFEVTNTSDLTVVLGCHNPWAIQRRFDGEWRHVTWTGERYYQLCASGLAPGDSLTEQITLSESELEAHADELQTDLVPGAYRFLLLGSSPYLATDFDVLE